jgi:hypothetical protein
MQRLYIYGIALAGHPGKNSTKSPVCGCINKKDWRSLANSPIGAIIYTFSAANSSYLAEPQYMEIY